MLCVYVIWEGRRDGREGQRREGRREGGTGGRDRGGRDGGREGGTDGRTDGGREGGREGKRGKEREREGKRGKEGGREREGKEGEGDEFILPATYLLLLSYTPLYLYYSLVCLFVRLSVVMDGRSEGHYRALHGAVAGVGTGSCNSSEL